MELSSRVEDILSIELFRVGEIPSSEYGRSQIEKLLGVHPSVSLDEGSP